MFIKIILRVMWPLPNSYMGLVDTSFDMCQLVQNEAQVFMSRHMYMGIVLCITDS